MILNFYFIPSKNAHGSFLHLPTLTRSGRRTICPNWIRKDVNEAYKYYLLLKLPILKNRFKIMAARAFWKHVQKIGQPYICKKPYQHLERQNTGQESFSKSWWLIIQKWIRHFTSLYTVEISHSIHSTQNSLRFSLANTKFFQWMLNLLMTIFHLQDKP